MTIKKQEPSTLMRAVLKRQAEKEQQREYDRQSEPIDKILKATPFGRNLWLIDGQVYPGKTLGHTKSPCVYVVNAGRPAAAFYIPSRDQELAAAYYAGLNPAPTPTEITTEDDLCQAIIQIREKPRTPAWWARVGALYWQLKKVIPNYGFSEIARVVGMTTDHTRRAIKKNYTANH